jgi:hypothetical protein
VVTYAQWSYGCGNNTPNEFHSVYQSGPMCYDISIDGNLINTYYASFYWACPSGSRGGGQLRYCFTP